MTVAPVGAVEGDRFEMFGGPGVTKTTPLLNVPATFTTTCPVVAPLGTTAPMLDEFQLVTLAKTPLNVTVLLPCDTPKSAPEIVIEVPVGPSGGDKLKMAGTFVTVKLTGLLPTPDTLTTTFPVVAPVGTVPVMLVADHAEMLIAVPFNIAVLVPCVSPKFEPEIWTVAPRSPLVGDTLEMKGVGSTANSTRLLPTPPTWTTISPVVSFGTVTTILVGVQVVTVAAVWFS